MNDEIATLIDKAARLAGQRVSGGRLGDLAGLPEGLSAAALFAEAWRAAGREGDPERLRGPTPANLPLAGWRADLGWFLVQGRGADGLWRAERLDGSALSLERLDGVECLSLPRRSETSVAAPGAMLLVWQALLAHKSVFLEAVLATGLVNLLTLATSLYAMQIYDRVIPNQGFQTLWVLSVGVALAVGLEFLLKQVRSHTVDRTCNAIDQQLSEWFFNRMMGIRMEARPATGSNVDERPVDDARFVELFDRLWNDLRRRDDRSEFSECEACGRAVRWVINLGSAWGGNIQIVARPVATAALYDPQQHAGLVAVFTDRTGFTVSRFTPVDEVDQ